MGGNSYTIDGVPGPTVSPDAFVGPGAILIGDVTVKAGATIWPCAVLRGDIARVEIGANASIQDNCTVHVDRSNPTVVGDCVTVGHGAIIHGAVIEDDVLIGMNATILTGAVVGAGSVIGANALVTENAKIPPHSLVLGVPGKVVRELGADQAEKNHHHALGYAQMGRRFRAEIRET